MSDVQATRYRRIYVGAALRDASIDPIDVVLDDESDDALENMVVPAWRTLLSLLATVDGERR